MRRGWEKMKIGKIYQGLKGYGILLTLCFSLVGFSSLFISCGSVDTGEDEIKWELPKGLKAVSVYGEKDFSDWKVFFRGWEADAPQTIFITGGEKTYFTAYVIPEGLAKSIGVQEKLSHFLSGEYINVDAKTTALTLVMIAPPYFWAFSPRALVYAASVVVEHEEFPILVEMIEKVKPGELFSGNHTDVFAKAYKIAGDVREKILSAGKTAELLAPHIGEKSECDNNMSGIAEMSSVPGLKVKFTVRNMIFYGGAVFRSDDIGNTEARNITSFFVLKAQDGKIDLSLGNILSFNIINPAVDTIVQIPDTDRHGIRVEKGVELSTSIFTDPIKRIGLVANFGRIVKYAIEVAVPNIAACIPDGDTWGTFVATAQNLITNGDITGIKDVLSTSWDELVRNIVNQFVNQNSWIYSLIQKIGFASCAYSPNFIINQIAALLRNFPIVKIYDAFTRYIPFGYELWTKPKSGSAIVIQGFPLGGEVPILKSVYPTPASSPGTIFIELIGNCLNCVLRINCPEFWVENFNIISSCGQPARVDIPMNFYGNCQAMLVYRYQSGGDSGLIGFVKGLLGISEAPGTYEIITSKWSLQIKNCPQCVNNPSGSAGSGGGNEGEEQGGGGCSTSFPMNPYHIFAIFVIFLRRMKFKKESK
jgi:hypothetical protein